MKPMESTKRYEMQCSGLEDARRSEKPRLTSEERRHKFDQNYREL